MLSVLLPCHLAAPGRNIAYLLEAKGARTQKARELPWLNVVQGVARNIITLAAHFVHVKSNAPSAGQMGASAFRSAKLARDVLSLAVNKCHRLTVMGGVTRLSQGLDAKKCSALAVAR